MLKTSNSFGQNHQLVPSKSILMWLGSVIRTLLDLAWLLEMIKGSLIDGASCCCSASEAEARAALLAFSLA